MARTALAGFRLTRPEARARAAELRADPVPDDPSWTFEQLTMLTALRPVAHLVTDPAVAAELAAWTAIQPGLYPAP